MQIVESSPYSYAVKIAAGCEIFTTGEMSKIFDTCGEMIIKSKEFEAYDVCIETLIDLLTNLSSAMAKQSSKSYVIVTKINPILIATEQNSSDKEETWGNDTVVKLYVADADALKNNATLLYSISSELYCSNIDAFKRCLPSQDVQ